MAVEDALALRQAPSIARESKSKSGQSRAIALHDGEVDAPVDWRAA